MIDVILFFQHRWYRWRSGGHCEICRQEFRFLPHYESLGLEDHPLKVVFRAWRWKPPVCSTPGRTVWTIAGVGAELRVGRHHWMWLPAIPSFQLHLEAMKRRVEASRMAGIEALDRHG